MMADWGAITDSHSSLILKTAAGIDEDVFAEMDISPEIGIKRRNHGKGRIDFFPGQLCHQLEQFFWGVRTIEFSWSYAWLQQDFQIKRAEARVDQEDITISEKKFCPGMGKSWTELVRLVSIVLDGMICESNARIHTRRNFLLLVKAWQTVTVQQ